MNQIYNKKKLLIFVTLISLSVCNAQFNPYLPARVILKKGDTLNGVIGKLKTKTFKYKLHKKAKPKQIDFSKIKSVQIRYSNNETKTSYFFQVKGENRFIPVQEFIKGKYLEVYGVIYSFNSTGAGEMAISGTGVNYYVKKSVEDKLTLIGGYDALIGEFKRRVYNYFSDCELLIQKLKEKELRLRNGLEEIAIFYNENCGKE